jgi:L-rhamnose mutarotase
MKRFAFKMKLKPGNEAEYSVRFNVTAAVAVA